MQALFCETSLFVCVAQAGSGFEELHRFMKQGNEFCKEFEVLLSERYLSLPNLESFSWQ